MLFALFGFAAMFIAGFGDFISFSLKQLSINESNFSFYTSKLRSKILRNGL